MVERYGLGGHTLWIVVGAVGVVLVGVLLLGRHDGTGGYQASPPPAVTVQTPEVRSVTSYLELTGTLRPVKHVDVRARVQGFLESTHFEEGERVAAGDLLYIIDPRPFQAKADAAEAEVARRQAELELAVGDLTRNQTLLERGTIPEATFAEIKAAHDTAVAALAAAEASLAEARLDLDFTQVRAPIDGRAGRHLVQIGNLVGAGEPTHLTTILEYDPIWAYLSISEGELLQLMRGTRQRDRDRQIHLALPGDDGFPHEGRIDYVDQAVDPDTGTFFLRGRFANPAPPALLPGMFVRVRVPIGERSNALLVPETALGSGQIGRFVYLVGEDDVVEQRRITVGAKVDALRVITGGLAPDERVIVNGLLRARPGAKVAPQTADTQARP